jgi:hypothetical protein
MLSFGRRKYRTRENDKGRTYEEYNEDDRSETSDL